MIFKQCQQVLDGTKTQTRRLAKEGEQTWICGLTEDGKMAYTEVSNANGRIRFRRGQLLPVIPKRGQKAIRDESGNIRRVRVVGLHRERLQGITEADARAEGVGSVAEYKALWESINGKTKGARWVDNPQVWVLVFEVV